LQAGHYVFLTQAWMPVLLLCVERAVERHRLGHAVAAGIVGAFLVTGSHPQLLLYLGLVATLVSLPSILVRSRSGGERSLAPFRFKIILASFGWWLASWTIAAVVAGGLAAVQWLPSLELIAATTRARLIHPEYNLSYGLVFHNLREFVRQTLALVGPQNVGGNPWENVGAFGVLWAGVALLALFCCRRPAVWFHGTLLLLMILFAFGSSTPVYPYLVHVVP